MIQLNSILLFEQNCLKQVCKFFIVVLNFHIQVQRVHHIAWNLKLAERLLVLIQ